MWLVEYHPAVEQDLRSLGRAEARMILKVIEERIVHGEPDKLGKSLPGMLSLIPWLNDHQARCKCGIA